MASANHWSSSTNETVPSYAWLADIFDGIVGLNGFGKISTLWVWPVRDGH